MGGLPWPGNDRRSPNPLETQGMDIVDAQVHLFLTMDTAAGLAALDALGIQAALIDEFWGYEGDSHEPPPGYRTPAGVFRPIAPGAAMASMKHPERFSWLLRIDPRDAQMNALMAQVRDAPQGRALRLEARSEAEVARLAAGGCMDFFRAAQAHGLPVFVLSPGNAALLEPYARALPDLKLVVDHCGLPGTLEAYGEVLALARHRNVYLKWCHAPRVFGATAYPFPEVFAHLARAIDAFGRERILWASDFTAIRMGCSWAEALFYLRDHAGLSADDKAWILGRSVRTLLDWPAPATPSRPAQHRH